MAAVSDALAEYVREAVRTLEAQLEDMEQIHIAELIVARRERDTTLAAVREEAENWKEGIERPLALSILAILDGEEEE